jgi:Myb-like DNA-binding domain
MIQMLDKTNIKNMVPMKYQYTMVKYNNGRWNSKEIFLFEQAIKLKLSWRKISEQVVTRNPDQCRSHNQKLKVSRKTNRTDTRTM